MRRKFNHNNSRIKIMNALTARMTVSDSHSFPIQEEPLQEASQPPDLMATEAEQPLKEQEQLPSASERKDDGMQPEGRPMTEAERSAVLARLFDFVATPSRSTHPTCHRPLGLLQQPPLSLREEEKKLSRSLSPRVWKDNWTRKRVWKRKFNRKRAATLRMARQTKKWTTPGTPMTKQMP